MKLKLEEDITCRSYIAQMRDRRLIARLSSLRSPRNLIITEPISLYLSSSVSLSTPCLSSKGIMRDPCSPPTARLKRHDCILIHLSFPESPMQRPVTQNNPPSSAILLSIGRVSAAQCKRSPSYNHSRWVLGPGSTFAGSHPDGVLINRCPERGCIVARRSANRLYVIPGNRSRLRSC